SWVDNIDGKSRAPFIITPPLFRLEAGDDSSLRIIKTADNLPENKESLFYINVRAIPAKKKSDDVNANELTLVFKTRIKMFYRPAHLKGRVNDAWKSLEFKRSDHSLNIYNPTEYYVVFAGLAVDKTDLTSKIEYIAPGEHKQLQLPASGGKNVKWAAINDYGGSSGTETRPLQ
ncbi:TPA: molecular chaperone, partial [Escherichia coli]|nr:molecular chaperone [Escherichia coli]HEH7792767.1 molecular chaperone [Escherichia coli]